MGLIDRTPKEVKIARLLHQYYNLKVPFDLEEVVKKHAKLIYKEIPIVGVDGVTLNLKVPGKIPTIVVNKRSPINRQRFTLAHELGHIMIPSHIGTIVDDLYPQEHLDFHYWWLEQEANSFAAEFLMPQSWILTMYEKFGSNLEKLHYEVATCASVSDQAAAIRIIQELPAEITFIAVEGGEVINTGKTQRSTAQVPKRGSEFDEDYYTHIQSHSVFHSGMVHYHWYDLNTSVEIDISDERPWRDILNKIIADITPFSEREQMRKSINGIVSNGHSGAKMNPNYSLDLVIIAITNRLKRDGLERFIKHTDFEAFVHKRAYDFFHGIKGK